jgi:hypothetical protein
MHVWLEMIGNFRRTRACAYRKSNPDILMLWAAENWPRFDEPDGMNDPAENLQAARQQNVPAFA